MLVPTRELANQVAEALTPLARAMSLRVTTVIGGAGQRPQVDSLRRGIDVLVACPGRLEDLIRQRHCRLDRVEVTVIDEADLMADLGFLPAVQRLLDQTPSGGQRLLFSATLDHGIDGLVRRYLTDPVTHAVDSEASAPPELDHHVLTVSTGDKPAIVHQLASGNRAGAALHPHQARGQEARRQLSAAGIPATELHGNLAQAARERNLAAFANGSARVLVATDIASRGIHVDDIALVVHVDPPAEHKAYLHRSGRTARAGASGIVVTRRDARAGQGRACTRSSRPCPPDDHQGHPGARVARGARRTAAGAVLHAGRQTDAGAIEAGGAHARVDRSTLGEMAGPARRGVLRELLADRGAAGAKAPTRTLNLRLRER